MKEKAIMKYFAPVFSLTIKELKLLIRDPGGLVLLFALPAFFIFILSISLQGAFSSPDKKDKMDILVINEDQGEVGKRLISGLDKIGYFKAVTEVNGKEPGIDEAKRLLQKAKYKIVVHIPEDASLAVDFEKDADINIYTDPTLSNDFAAHITNAIQSFVYVSIIMNVSKISRNVFDKIKKERVYDISKKLEVTVKKRDQLKVQLEEIARTEMDEEIKEIFDELSRSNINELNQMILDLRSQVNELQRDDFAFNEDDFDSASKSKLGLKVNQIYYSGSTGGEVFPNSVQQNVPGWTIFALFWIVQILTINLITERQSGAFKRILIAPVSMNQFVLGKVIPFFLISLLQAVVMFSIGIFILPLFGCPALVLKNVFGLILVTISVTFVVISLSLLISSLSKTIFLAASLSAFLIILLAVVGGIMVPKFIMPVFMQKMSLLVPHGWALDAYLNILVRDYSVAQVLPNIAVLLGFGILFFVTSLFFLKRVIRSAE